MLAVALLGTPVWADADARFAKLRDGAEPLGGLSAFVDKYVGDCASKLMGGADCTAQAELFRQGASGKKYYVIFNEETASVLQMGPMKSNDGAFVLNLVPFFPAAGSALSHGAPLKTDAQGNPQLPFIRIDGQLPEGWSPPMMIRQVNAQAMRIQVVFTPLGLWSLPKKGGGSIKGIKARFDAVRVTVGRSGEQVGLWLASDK